MKRPGRGELGLPGTSGATDGDDAAVAESGDRLSEAGEKDELSGSGQDRLVKEPKSSSSGSGDEESGRVVGAKLGRGAGEAEAATEPDSCCTSSSNDFLRPFLCMGPIRY